MTNKGALNGITVLEIGDRLTQFAGKMLADMGAEVIKVEPETGGDSRKIGPFYKDVYSINRSLYFWSYNTSKKSVTIDIFSSKGKDQLINLLSDVDIILEDYKPGRLEEYGLGYETVKTSHKHIVYCSITPFGQDGPWRDYKSSDLTQLALGGIMAVTGYDDVKDAPPIAPTGGQSYHLAGYFGAMGILSAILYRDMISGEGQHVDISVHEAVAVSTEMSIPYWIYQGTHVKRQTGRHALPNPSVRWNLKCKDGRYILCLNTYLDKKRWKGLVEWLTSHDLEEDLGDERYEDNNYRAQKMEHVTNVLERFCSHFKAEYIYHKAQSIGLPWAPVRAPEEMLEDEHLTEDREAFIKVEHPELQTDITYPGAPYIFHKTPWNITSRPPLLGEHNNEILNNKKIQVAKRLINIGRK